MPMIKEYLFSLLVVTRGEQEFPLLRPQEDNSAFKASAKGTKYEKGENTVAVENEKKAKRGDKMEKVKK